MYIPENIGFCSKDHNIEMGDFVNVTHRDFCPILHYLHVRSKHISIPNNNCTRAPPHQIHTFDYNLHQYMYYLYQYTQQYIVTQRSSLLERARNSSNGWRQQHSWCIFWVFLQRSILDEKCATLSFKFQFSIITYYQRYYYKLIFCLIEGRESLH